MALGTHSGTYHEGDFAAICDICGRRFRRSQMTFNWKHQLVCNVGQHGSGCWEPRNPQDYAVHPKGDVQAVPEPRPRLTPVFIDETLPPDPDSLPPTCGFGPGAVQSS